MDTGLGVESRDPEPPGAFYVRMTLGTQGSSEASGPEPCLEFTTNLGPSVGNGGQLARK